MLVIVGLGNPGARYRNTRHNAGFMVLDRLVGGEGLPDIRFGRGREGFLRADDGKSGSGRSRLLLELEGEIGNIDFVLVKPLTFMNESGRAITSLITRGVVKDLSEMLVITDDTNLDIGRARYRDKGSAGGHNGLSSIISALGTGEFPRIRIGIGPRPSGDELVEFVLGEFTPDERTALRPAIDTSARAAAAWVDQGPEATLRELETISRFYSTTLYKYHFLLADPQYGAEVPVFRRCARAGGKHRTRKGQSSRRYVCRLSLSVLSLPFSHWFTGCS